MAENGEKNNGKSKVTNYRRATVSGSSLLGDTGDMPRCIHRHASSLSRVRIASVGIASGCFLLLCLPSLPSGFLCGCNPRSGLRRHLAAFACRFGWLGSVVRSHKSGESCIQCRQLFLYFVLL